MLRKQGAAPPTAGGGGSAGAARLGVLRPGAAVRSVLTRLCLQRGGGGGGGAAARRLPRAPASERVALVTGLDGAGLRAQVAILFAGPEGPRPAEWKLARWDLIPYKTLQQRLDDRQLKDRLEKPNPQLWERVQRWPTPDTAGTEKRVAQLGPNRARPWTVPQGMQPETADSSQERQRELLEDLKQRELLEELNQLEDDEEAWTYFEKSHPGRSTRWLAFTWAALTTAERGKYHQMTGLGHTPTPLRPRRDGAHARPPPGASQGAGGAAAAATDKPKVVPRPRATEGGYDAAGAAAGAAMRTKPAPPPPSRRTADEGGWREAGKKSPERSRDSQLGQQADSGYSEGEDPHVGELTKTMEVKRPYVWGSYGGATPTPAEAKLREEVANATAAAKKNAWELHEEKRRAKGLETALHQKAQELIHALTTRPYAGEPGEGAKAEKQKMMNGQRLLICEKTNTIEEGLLREAKLASQLEAALEETRAANAFIFAGKPGGAVAIQLLATPSDGADSTEEDKVTFHYHVDPAREAAWKAAWKAEELAADAKAKAGTKRAAEARTAAGTAAEERAVERAAAEERTAKAAREAVSAAAAAAAAKSALAAAKAAARGAATERATTAKATEERVAESAAGDKAEEAARVKAEREAASAAAPDRARAADGERALQRPVLAQQEAAPSATRADALQAEAVAAAKRDLNCTLVARVAAVEAASDRAAADRAATNEAATAGVRSAATVAKTTTKDTAVEETATPRTAAERDDLRDTAVHADDVDEPLRRSGRVADRAAAAHVKTDTSYLF